MALSLSQGTLKAIPDELHNEDLSRENPKIPKDITPPSGDPSHIACRAVLTATLQHVTLVNLAIESETPGEATGNGPHVNQENDVTSIVLDI